MAAEEVRMSGTVVWEVINGIVYVQGSTEVIPYDTVEFRRDQAATSETAAQDNVTRAQDALLIATQNRESWDNLLALATP